MISSSHFEKKHMKLTPGYTLVELMVGLLIGSALTAGMLVFLGSASSSFHTQMDSVNDRSSMKRAMTMMAQSMMEAGYQADQMGKIEAHGSEVFFLDANDSLNWPDAYTPLSGYDYMHFYRPTDDIETLSTSGAVPTWEAVYYFVEQEKDPVMVDGEGNPVVINVLKRATYDGDTYSDPQPILFGVTEFNLEYGNFKGEFNESFPNSGDKEDIYGLEMTSLRFTIATETKILSAVAGDEGVDPITQRLTQAVHFRNRQLSEDKL